MKALNGPTALNLPIGSYEILPEVSENKSAINNVFSGVSGVDVDQTIYFVVKSGGKYISKKALILHKDVAVTGSNTYRLYTLSQNEGAPINTTPAHSFTGTATGTFSSSEVINGAVTLEFFA